MRDISYLNLLEVGMTVIFYEEGEHDAGFVGFRVARTVGVNSDYRQAYFSLNDYSYEEAELLAHKENDKWEALANDVIKGNRLTKRRKSWGANIIVEGLRAYIGVERKLRYGKVRTYFAPSFNVKNPGYRKGDFIFRTTTYGYEKAYKLAVDKYCETHEYSSDTRVILLEKIPCKTIFTEFLYDSLIKRNHQVTKEEILVKLSM